MTANDLETPGSPEDLYLARGDEADELRDRPVFTGDLIQLEGQNLVCVLQHPCAFRNGSSLATRILVGDVAAVNDVPTDWSTGHFKAMFLPEVEGEGSGAVRVKFQDIQIVEPQRLEGGERVAILSAYGVNLLLQRWIHHNARIVVPTSRLETSTAGPFDEADLIGDSVPDLVAKGMTTSQALAWIEAWLSADHGGTGSSRRVALVSRQTAGSVRAELRRAIVAAPRG